MTDQRFSYSLHEVKHLVTATCRGKWFGSYGVCFCPAHDNRRTPALRISLGYGGRLLAKCSAGCTFAEVVCALGLQGRPADQCPRRDPLSEMAWAAQQATDRTRRIEAARRIWEAAEPAEATIVARYLRHRCITIPPPDTLRFHPRAWHDIDRRFLPAMIACVELDLDLVAVHRTYLEEPGRKIRSGQARLMKGPTKGGAVRLIAGPAPLIVGEGIETTLSAAEGLGAGYSAWATLSTSGMSGLRLPERPSRLIIAADNDGGAGITAAKTLAARAHAAGWSVKILTPPHPFKDWNDVAAAAIVERSTQWG